MNPSSTPPHEIQHIFNAVKREEIPEPLHHCKVVFCSANKPVDIKSLRGHVYKYLDWDTNINDKCIIQTQQKTGQTWVQYYFRLMNVDDINEVRNLLLTVVPEFIGNKSGINFETICGIILNRLKGKSSDKEDALLSRPDFICPKFWRFSVLWIINFNRLPNDKKIDPLFLVSCDNLYNPKLIPAKLNGMSNYHVRLLNGINDPEIEFYYQQWTAKIAPTLRKNLGSKQTIQERHAFILEQINMWYNQGS